MTSTQTVLILGGMGKTGSRVAERLKARSIPVRVGSRSTQPAFDWTAPDTWDAVLENVHAIYIAYQPDLAVPGADTAIRTLTERAAANGVKRLVLLSGRGEEEAQKSEQIVQDSGLEWTIVQASWFFQNFSEGMLLDPVLSGQVILPAGDIQEPFIDVDDIADVAVAALTDDKHIGQVYEVSGPRLMTFREAVQEIAHASGREIQYIQVPQEDYNAALSEAGVPADYVWLLNYLFTNVLDGRNASLADGVERALGRKPRDFADYARETAATGIWNGQAVQG